jgi:von Willebrand factor type A domain
MRLSKKIGFQKGDLNRDGESNTLLDAEIASILALLEKIAFDPTLGNHNVNIGLITFSSQAKYHGDFLPCDTKNPSLINPALKMKLLSLRSSGYTNFESALEKVLQYFRRPSLAGSNLLYLLSDGIPSPAGDEDVEDPIEMPIETYPMTVNYEKILQELDFMNVKRFSFGIGSTSDTRKGFVLDTIDSKHYLHVDMRPQQMITHDDINNSLFSNPIIGKIIDFGISVNRILQGDFDASNVVSSLTGFTFGTFVVRDLNPMYGESNRVTASVTIDFDGNIATSSDQITILVEDVIVGGLI